MSERGAAAGIALALITAFGFSLKAIFSKLACPYGVVVQG